MSSIDLPELLLLCKSLCKSLSVYLRLIATGKHAFTANAEALLHRTHTTIVRHLGQHTALHTALHRDIISLVVMHDKLLTHLPCDLCALAPLVPVRGAVKTQCI